MTVLRREYRTCEVLLNTNDCTASSGSEVSTRSTCFACGKPACSACSRRVTWHSFGRQRICNDCLEGK